ncbi:hypothetical protein OCS_03058 [Ophiocordyceps sinensis CO18]|uniref:Uncharacterized protein n=1 Tax=Ophiocordyceps sinensis (strain Co18 / CGMCC 3.14243) TaxID=911162 RepID=T5AHC5_OPHSC|nr:hypothetical protein OCS_03058 [Ophiocordyceps sinensis CO18]
MQMLGFAPYHMKEVITSGAPHMKLLVESMRAEYDAFSGIKRYSKEDSDKWFSDYDVGPAPPPPVASLRLRQ